MSSTVALSTEPTRRRLTDRQARTVERLASAAVDEVRVRGYDGLTVRSVARRAGVAPATAYTYFGSKDHLLAEVFWRRLRSLPEAKLDRRRGAAARVGAALSEVTREVGAEPELAAAWTTAMLATDLDVKHLRDRIGGEIRRRLVSALGDEADPAALRTLELVITGAMVQAGMGHLEYDDLPERVAEAAELILDTR